MDQAEAIDLATAFMSRQSGYNVILEPTLVLLIRAAKCPDLYAHDTWVVHFPMKLPDEVLFQEPDTLIVEVDAVTQYVKIFNSL